MKDWSGNKQSVFSTLGAKNYSSEERESNDYYASQPKAAQLLMEKERFSPVIWECACGEGHLAKEFEKAGYKVYATDLIDRGFGKIQDFLLTTSLPEVGADIITNPPYKQSLEFAEHAMSLFDDGGKLAMLLKLQFLEGKARKKFFAVYPAKTIYVSSSRLICAKNGDFEKYKTANAVCYAWFVWEKGYTGKMTVELIN